MSIIETVKKFFGIEKIEEIKPKKKLSSSEKFAGMSEARRIIYFDEQARIAELKSNKEMQVDMIDKRQKDYFIRFEFSPKKQNFVNCRSHLQYEENKKGHLHSAWSYIRDFEEQQAGEKCIKCGGTGLDSGFKHKTEAHEVWEYNTIYLKEPKTVISGTYSYDLKVGKQRIQTLKSIESLCPMCHGIKHINRFKRNQQDFDILKSAYMILNNVNEEQFNIDYEAAQIKQINLDDKYLLDTSKLLDSGYSKEMEERLIEYNVDKLFNSHSNEFQQFLDGEYRSKGEKDNG